MIRDGFNPEVPLLNEYKYGLCRRKVLQNIFGGPVVRKVPFLIHLIQALLWLFPLICVIPFILLDALKVWNTYFLALVYGIMIGISSASLEVLLFIIIQRHRGWEQRIQFDYESEEIYIPSICSIEAVSFIFELRQKSDIILRPIASGLVSFVGCYILFPTVLQETLPIPWTVVVCAIGWLVLPITHYSLMARAPPETAVYRATCPYVLRIHHRPLYILIIGICIIIIRVVVTSNMKLYLYILYGSLCLLPLGWLLGVFPPPDAFVPWIMELVQTRLFGGSSTATDLRLVIAFSMTIIALIVGTTIRNATASLLLLTSFGFFLSQDIYVYTKVFLYKISCICNNRLGRFIISKTHRVFSTTLQSYSGVGDVHQLKKYWICFSSLGLIRNYLMLLISLLIIHYTSILNIATSRREQLAQIMSIVWIVLNGLVLANDQLQMTYLFGIIRNLLQPKLSSNLLKYDQKKTIADMISIPRKIILAYLAPLLAIAFVGLVMGPIPASIIERLAIARLLRKIWQNMESVLAELTVTSIVILASGYQLSIGFPLLTLLVGISVDIATDFLQKIVFVGKLLITYFALHKQRTYTFISVIICACNFIFFPLLIVVILFSSILAAPLLPIFSLPIFVVGFPRTRRFWPSLTDYGRVSMKTSDSIYYQEVELKLGAVIYKSISCGAISSQPGTQVMFRFDNRLGLITILEKEYDSCVVNLRGLEFQETSCHSEEATMVDSMFDKAHGSDILNKAIVSTLTPSDTRVIKAYSDAHNVLTGIIDQPVALKKFSSNLRKTLVWVFYQHLFKRSKANPPCSNIAQRFVVRSPTISDNFKPTQADPVKVQQVDVMNTQSTVVQPFGNSGYPRLFRRDEPEDIIVKTAEMPNKATENMKGKSDTELENDLQTIASMFEITRSVSDSIVSAPPKPRVPYPRGTGKVYPITTLLSTESEQANIWLEEDAVSSTVTLSSRLSSSRSHVEAEIPSNIRTYRTMSPQRDHGNRPQTASSGTLSDTFPMEWYSHLTNRYWQLDNKDYNYLQEIVESSFNFLYVVSSHHWSLQSVESHISPQQIVEGFQGSFPHKPESNWVRENSELMGMAVKAYRYAVKLMYDEGCLGDIETLEELVTYLEDYKNNWCIVSEKEEEWNAAILSNSPHLFSVDHDPEEQKFTAHVLSMQETAVHLGSLNKAALQGLWANMNFELVYLTNDDDERYSIQAHPYLLRNISSQLCDPPLGYCVYSSGPLTIPST